MMVPSFYYLRMTELVKRFLGNRRFSFGASTSVDSIFKSMLVSISLAASFIYA